MKKSILTILALVLALSLTACGNSKSNNELTIGTSPDYPPFESLDSSNNIIGIEVDLVNMICEELGMTPVYKQMDFESVLPGVASGKINMGMSGITVTEKRKENALFTDPYCLAAQAIVVPSGSAIASKADLTGKTISVQTGTTAEEYCMGEGFDVNAYASNSDARQALVTGKVDAWVIDDLTAAAMVKEYNEENDDQLVILDEAMTTEPYAFAFKLGNEELVDKINTVLKKLIEDGTVKALFEKYDAPYTSPLN